ncbi:MAG: glycoside hydrolase family 2 protein, partial [Chloroflexota bacterium]
MTYMLEWFQLPNSFENTAWLSQIQQGMAIKYAVEHWRRTMPRGMGTLYWQLNDCWPVASWSSLDSLGKWKGLHYMAKHFFAPTLLSAVEDLDAQTITLHVTHDVPDSREGIVSWQIITANKGDVVQAGKMDCQFQGPASLEVGTIDLADALAKHDVRNLLVRMWLEVSDEMVSTNLVHLSRPKHVMLADPELKCSISKSGDTAVITINAARPAMWAWLEFDGSAHGLSDNFFHLFPGDEKVVTFKTDLSAAELNDQLKISSLWDTFSTR